MRIRSGRATDAPALAKLARETYSEAFGHSLTPDDLSAHLSKNLSAANFKRILARDTVLIAEEDEHMVGFVQFGDAAGYLEADSETDRAVNRLYVHADFRNRGIGRLLMDTALEHLRLEGAGRVFLDVWERNSDARRFYGRYGFRTVGKRAFGVASGAETSPDLVMMLRLGKRSRRRG
jgi:ribosomal protein S18 acetylase RimI-like enzyme